MYISTMSYSSCSVYNNSFFFIDVCRPPRGRCPDQMDFSLPGEIRCFLLKQGKIDWSGIILLCMYNVEIIPIVTHSGSSETFTWLISLSLSLSPSPLLSLTHTFFSAKTKDGVQEAFEELVHKVLQTPSLYTTDSPSSSFNVTGQEGEATQEGWGCSCW